MIDVDAMKEAAAAAEMEVANLRAQLSDLQTKQGQLRADSQSEEAALAQGEQTAASRRAEAAMARAEGRLSSTVRIPDVAVLREAARTTKDAIIYIDDKIAELEPEIDKAEARKQSALGRLARYEVGAFLLEVAPLLAEINLRIEEKLGSSDAKSVKRALVKALGLDTVTATHRDIVHEGMMRIFGYASPESSHCAIIADRLHLPSQIASVLPVIGRPSATVREALSDERLASPADPKFVELKPKPQRTAGSTWPISARGA